MKKTEVVITAANRTAVGALGKSLKNVHAYELGSASIKKLNIKVDITVLVKNGIAKK